MSLDGTRKAHFLTAEDHTMSDQQLILGLGTGRCRTVSLASFLNAQPDTRVVHEGFFKGENHLVHWNEDAGEAIRWLETLEHRVETRRFGDVAYYYLPHAATILERWPDARFAVLQRERESTVDSFLHKTRWRNHWMEHDGTEWWKDPVYDPTFPTLDASSKKDAVEQYWDLYYDRVDTLRASWPHAYALYKMHDLNTREGRREILSFLEYADDEMVLSGSFRKNTATRNFLSDWWHRFRRMARRVIPGYPPRSDQ